jgi:hypothetical protein
MSQILNETKKDHVITTREGVHVTVTGVPTKIRTCEGEEIHSIGVALRLEQLVKATVAQNPTPGRVVELEFA